ncbi:MAG: peptide deformylase [Deferribacteraceae bacterium]|jgi:peptide deformylase|nr:peptide deformylase [Deferribacteraceae bacterium]
MTLDIVTFPAESLRRRTERVTEITDEIRALIANMKETMYTAKGYGLAAPQVGKSLRILVLDDNGSRGPQNPRAFINPEIISSEGEILEEEGCLSLPGEWAMVKRFEKVTVKALDENGAELIIEADGQLSRIFQHEIDHLNGILFIDKIPPFKRDTIKKHIKRRIQAGDYAVIA